MHFVGHYAWEKVVLPVVIVGSTQALIFYEILVCVYYDPPAIIIFMFYLPIHTMLVVKFVVGLGKTVLHFMYTVCLQG